MNVSLWQDSSHLTPALLDHLVSALRWTTMLLSHQIPVTWSTNMFHNGQAQAHCSHPPGYSATMWSHYTQTSGTKTFPVKTHLCIFLPALWTGTHTHIYDIATIFFLDYCAKVAFFYSSCIFYVFFSGIFICCVFPIRNHDLLCDLMIAFF